jgi:hypothetical protein
MRYLSKIVFINTADKSLKYAEVDLDGNVHFIGTQGVGKSTLLRAILFFYNANTQKLGIPREKKNYNEYYFPYQNSYIVYEVQTETGPFCVLTFKTQNRVAFRFFNSQYDKRYFIDSQGKAYENWGKTRDAFGKDVGYTRIVNNYEEYRNILYGNNKGLPSEFRKYALLESKQYQNIPRTISNVFLNAKLDAEFVKETIIKSLNEDEIKIDLTTYAQTHLKDFESNLNDIRIWTDKNSKGENRVEKQAETVSTTYSALRYLEQKKKDLAFQLGYALVNVKERQPVIQEHLRNEEQKRTKIQNKLSELDDVFEKKKGILQKKIGEVSGRLKDISSKKTEYQALDIESILARVAEKDALEIQKIHLTDEKDVLESEYLEIQQRYEAQINQLENQLAAFKNRKQTQKNTAQSDFFSAKNHLNEQYDLIFQKIRDQHQDELETAGSNIAGIEKKITDQKIRRSDIKHKRFYEAEIESCKNEYSAVSTEMSKAETSIQRAKNSIKALMKEWEFEEIKVKADDKREREQKIEEIEQLNERISSIESKIENSKNSLYGWLNDNLPDWDKTIGKVIDEDNVLFRQGLHPEKISHTESDPSFYGIHIDTHLIDKNVKTVDDLREERDNAKSDIQDLKQGISALEAQLNDSLEKLKRKFKPKISEQKEIIQTKEYALSTGKSTLDEIRVRLADWEKKAGTEKQEALQHIEQNINALSEEKNVAREHVEKIKRGINRSLNLSKKEKEKKIEAEQSKCDDIIERIEAEIRNEKQHIEQRKATIKSNQKNELDDKGANTERIDEIDAELSKINAELIFIENNRDKVAEYNKDKRELFDKEDTFKNEKKLLNKQIGNLTEKHKQQKSTLEDKLNGHSAEIDELKATLSACKNDLEEFERFAKTELYQQIEHFISDYPDNINHDHTCTYLINELRTTDSTETKRYVQLQEAINKFVGNFQEENIFRFQVKFTERTDYFEFAEMLSEFIEENKLLEYKKRVEERFAHIIGQIGRETNALIQKEGEISKVINDINNDFVARQFVTAVKSVELKTAQSANRIFQLLVEIKEYNDQNAYSVGKPSLFSSNGESNKNEKAISLLKQLIKEIASSREKEITLSDSFELLFKIVENDNDTGWVEKLTHVGSEGTDVLVKAMINIMLLNVFKEKASKKQTDDFRLHCMMDEIGKLHPTNVKGILKFANDRNILLINSSPTSLNATDYRYTYLLSKDNKNVTKVKRLVKKIKPLEPASQSLPI